jgi:hypothetical protein
MIHFHGTPLSPRSELLKMAGKHFCVPFSDGRDADWCLTHGQSVMWDNGAFTNFRQGGKLDVKAYYVWLENKLGHPHWAVVPDVIDGTESQQRELINTWPFAYELGAPVWHIGLGFDWLRELTDIWPKVCFGSSGAYWQIGSDSWCRRMDEAFNHLARYNSSLPYIHMLRGMALSGDRWPFASVDSVNVARNFKNEGQRCCPERMARRIDAIQCPIKWEIAPEQTALLFEGGFYDRAALSRTSEEA